MYIKSHLFFYITITNKFSGGYVSSLNGRQVQTFFLHTRYFLHLQFLYNYLTVSIIPL